MGAHQALALSSNTSIFSPASTPARSIYSLSLFVLAITGGIFVVVTALIAYAVVRFRQRPDDDGSEPAQIFGSNQIELSWTIIPVLIVVVLFLATARMIFAIQDAPEPAAAVDVTAIGHQFWWEFRYPALNITTANELHIPVSEPESPRPTYMKLTSADVIHSFWVPRLAGKTDLVPNRINALWMDPHTPGLYVGQCAQFCGVEHAKMLLRVYVDTPDQFAAWVKQEQQPGAQESAGSRRGDGSSSRRRASTATQLQVQSAAGTLWPGSDPPGQPQNDCRGRSRQHNRESGAVDRGAGFHQARLADAGHASLARADPGDHGVSEHIAVGGRERVGQAHGGVEHTGTGRDGRRGRDCAAPGLLRCMAGAAA